ncbi:MULTISPECIES: oligosaccharide flippase family protein [unclassified Halomonas]|uniref:lipopolysaccharide biosynthesis protein n=1 Tax=unclassified Halomonas TaxID=2609666 RepID=UPI002076BA47|nr:MULTISPECIES: oligosaccharide flippase family protein [unclassified Halomonas]
MNSLALGKLRVRASKFSKSSFVRNVVAVATGIAAAQAISLAFMPFLTRLYGPEAFGALAAFTAVINIISPIATLGYANAIVMPQTEEGATAVARLSLICASIMAPVALVIVLLFRAPIAHSLGLEAAPYLLYLIPVALLLSALLSVANQSAIREGLFKQKARSYVASTFLMNLGKLAGGLLAPYGLLLIIIMIGGKALNFTMLLSRVPKKGAFEVRRWFGRAGIRKAAIEQRDFVLYRMPQSMINAASLGLPVLVLTSLFSASIAGQYSITTLVLGAPIMLLGQSVLEVFFPRVTEAVRRNPANALPLIQRATLGMACIGIVPFGVIALWGDILLPWFFGDEWLRAGEYSRWVALWMASVLATRPAVSSMPVLRMQGTLLIYEVAITAARVLSLFIGANLGNDIVAVAVFALVNVAGYLVLLLLVLRKAAAIKRRGNDAYIT